MTDLLESSGRFDEVNWRKGMAQQFTLDAVCNGEIDACVDYTGNVWTNKMKRPRPADQRTTLREVTAYLKGEHGVECLGALGFENAYAVAIRKQDAADLKVKTLDDLRPHAPRMMIGGDLQFFNQGEWKHVQQTYALKFAGTPRELDATLMYEAIRRGKVDAIVAYTTDARLEAYGLVIVEDARRAFPSYDAILLLSREGQAKPGLREALQVLVTPRRKGYPLGPIDQERMIRTNRRIDVERSWPGKAAKELLEYLRSPTQEAS
jgi:osmoprotectant transport system permease protein